MSWPRCCGYGGGHRCSELTNDSGFIIGLCKDGTKSGPPKLVSVISYNVDTVDMLQILFEFIAKHVYLTQYYIRPNGMEDSCCVTSDIFDVTFCARCLGYSQTCFSPYIFTRRSPATLQSDAPQKTLGSYFFRSECKGPARFPGEEKLDSKISKNHPKMGYGL